MGRFALCILFAATGSSHGAIAIVPSNVAFVDISMTGQFLTPHATGRIDPNTWTGNELFGRNQVLRISPRGAILWGVFPDDPFTNSDRVGYFNAAPNAGSFHSSIATMTPANSVQYGNGNGLRQLIAPLWDFYGATPQSAMYWEVVNGDLIVQWNRMGAVAVGGTDTVTFQAIFRRGVSIASGQSLVDFVYQDTFFAPDTYANDGGSATIGYKNWGINANANDVEFGIGGGGFTASSDPPFGGMGMQPKVGGWVAASDANLPKSVSIVPAPGAAALLGLGGLLAARRRRA